MRRVNLSRFTSFAFAAALVLALGTGHVANAGSEQVTTDCDDLTTNGTTFSYSSTHHTTQSQETSPDVTVDRYETRVVGIHADVTVYDETIADAPTSQAVQNAEDDARDAIVAAGGSVASITGPTLIGSERTLEDTDTTQATEIDHVEETTTVDFTVGPSTIMTGEDKSLTCEVPAGTQNFNGNTHFETYETVTTTTTNTYLNTAHYELTDSGATQPNIWQDVDCSGTVSVRDNQALLRFILEQPPLSQTQPCPAVNAVVSVASFGAHPWGNGDCSATLGIRDNQATLRYILEQPPLSQTQPCPEVAQPITISLPN